MSKKKPQWVQLEIIVSDIQKQFAPGADVRHNHRVIGKSGRRRKLDVTISQKVSGIPIFIVFDCKHHTRPVSLKDVAAFSVQLEDVSATLGVMVSSSGFDAGAKAVAKQKNIFLQRFRKAGEADWKGLFGENAWAILTKVEMPQVNVVATLAGISSPVDIPFDMQILDEKGEPVGILRKTFWSLWREMGQPIGDFSGELFFEGLPSYVRRGEELTQIVSAILKAKIIAKKYVVNLHLAEGNIIEDDETDQPVYRSLASTGIDWVDVINTQPGMDMSPEEYQQILRESMIMADLSNAKRYVRILAEDKVE